MNLGIELRQLTLGGSGGVAQHVKGVIEALVRAHPEHNYTFFCTIFSRGLIDPVLGGQPNVTFVTSPTFKFWTDIDAAADAGQIDVLFRSFPFEDPLRFPLHRQVFLIPDLQHEAFPQFFDKETLRARRAAFNRAVARAGALGTSTAFTRKTIEDHPWTRCTNVFLMPPALQREHRSGDPLTTEERDLVPAGPYFLFPANVWPHKNHRRVLGAFDRFVRESGRPMQLVLTGHPEGVRELLENFPNLPVKHLGFVRPQLLRALLERATALTFFSLYEGFGMPLLEAFDAGTPVLCSNTTSLPEVGGDAALSCDPIDVAAMAGLMGRIASNEQLRRDLVAKGKSRLGVYTWQESAENLLRACETIATFPKDNFNVTSPKDARPLVSVVTPSYNQGQYLRRTIESVLHQTYKNIDYRVIDGGSTDDSAAILKSYGDRFPWVSEKDRGQTDAINKGMAQAKGEILAYLNSDDVLLPNAVERIVEHFRRHPDCDMVYGRANYIDENDNITGMYRTDEYSFPRLMKDCQVCQPATFWRKRIADIVGPFDESLHSVMDYDYWLRIDRAGGRIEHIHDVLAGYRLYPQTKTMSIRGKTYQEIFKVCPRAGGYVDLNYFYGLWHHRIFEAKTGWHRHLKWFPPALFAVAKWDYRRFNKMQRNWHGAAVNLAAAARQKLVNRVPAAERLLARVPQSFTQAVSRLAGTNGQHHHLPVRGFWGDNWLAPHCQILVRNKAPGTRLHLAGTTPVDSTLAIRADGAPVGTFPLKAGEYQFISPPVTLKLDRPLLIELDFSNYVPDPAHRRLAFLVHDTNLFNEHEVG